MASIAAACRLSARAASRQLRHQRGSVKAFHAAPAILAAQNFNMPALSPTMTEGNIAQWRVKEGDSFAAGDVLLEIETDKAQMDVEAQDDGVLAKIIQGDGAKSVQVGTRIAVTAESEDDLSALEIPPDDGPSPKQADGEGAAPQSKPKEESAPASKQEKPMETSPETSQHRNSPSAPKGGQAKKQIYPLYPSVQHLLRENGLPDEEAAKIPATGPNGRLLKGDVLAYIGRIEESYAAELSSRIGKLAHLDLSNIKPAAPKKEVAPQKPTPPPAAPLLEEVNTEVAIPISLKAVTECQKRVRESLGVFLPVSTFIARAAELANEGLPRSKTAKPTADELFDAVLGMHKAAGPKYSRARFVPQVIGLPSAPPLRTSRSSPTKQSDILDILAGKKSISRAAKPAVVGVAEGLLAPTNVFSVSAPKGEERRAQLFLERVKSVLEAEPGRLVV